MYATLTAPFSLILSAVFLNATAQVLLKWGMCGTNPQLDCPAGIYSFCQSACSWPIFSAMVCYGLSIFLWMAALAKVDVSFAYPFMSIGFVLVTLAGALFFQEILSPLRLMGIGFIIVGVILVARTSG